MREHINLTSEARYWIRTPEGKWHSVPQDQAAWVYGMPKGYYGDAKVETRRGRGVKEVAVLSVTPWSYTSSDVDRGLGVVLWDWVLGAVDCARVVASIEAMTGDDRRRTELTGREPSRFERSYAQLVDLLCETGVRSNPHREEDAYYIVNTRTGKVEEGPFTVDEADAIKHVRFDRNYQVIQGKWLTPIAFDSAANPRDDAVAHLSQPTKKLKAKLLR